MQENYGEKPLIEISQTLNRTAPSLYNMADRLGLRSPKPLPWSSSEIAYIKANWYRMKIKNMAKKIGRTESAIYTKAKELKLGPQLNPMKWTAREVSGLLKVETHIVTRWIRQKLLKADIAPSIKKKIYQVSTENLIDFLINNSDKWDARRCPDLHIDIRYKQLMGPAHWKAWGKKKREQRKIPSHLKPAFKKFILQVMNEAGDRINDSRKRPEWLEKKIESDQLLAAKRFKKWTRKEDTILARLYRKGASTQKIADTLGRSKISVERRMQRINPWKILDEDVMIID